MRALSWVRTSKDWCVNTGPCCFYGVVWRSAPRVKASWLRSGRTGWLINVPLQVLLKSCTNNCSTRLCGVFRDHLVENCLVLVAHTKSQRSGGQSFWFNTCAWHGRKARRSSYALGGYRVSRSKAILRRLGRQTSSPARVSLVCDTRRYTVRLHDDEVHRCRTRRFKPAISPSLLQRSERHSLGAAVARRASGTLARSSSRERDLRRRSTRDGYPIPRSGSAITARPRSGVHGPRESKARRTRRAHGVLARFQAPGRRRNFARRLRRT